MIYTFFGTDEKKARVKAHSFIEVVKKKRPDAPFFMVKAGEEARAQIEELSQGSGLFYEKQIVFVDQVFSEEYARDSAKELLPLMKQSESVFIILEGKLLTPEKKLFEKYSLEIKECDAGEKKKKEFNIFTLGDALIARDKIKLWSLYLEAIESGKTAEEIQGTLMWQAKNMALVSKVKSATEAGLKPFIFSKAKSAEKKYSKKELESLPWNLTKTHHRSRLDSEDLLLVLERWVLSL